jgi:hypothetical protein
MKELREHVLFTQTRFDFPSQAGGHCVLVLPAVDLQRWVTLAILITFLLGEPLTFSQNRPNSTILLLVEHRCTEGP